MTADRALTVAPASAPALTSGQILQGLHTVKTVLAPDLSDDELKLFAMVSSRSGLDPFAKQVYAVKRQGRVTFQTGIDGYRSIAARTGLYDGQDEPEYSAPCTCGDNRPAGHPESATVRVYRKGVSRPIAATAFWHEYKPEAGQNGRGDAMWTRMPRVMLAKVAEALALRKAFPYDPENRQGIGADLYTADEMAQAERPAPAAAPAPSVRERVAQRARAAAPVAAPEEPQDAEYRELDVEAIDVGFRIDGDRLDAEFFAGPDDAQRDLAPVGDQDFFEHGLFQPEERLPELDRLSVFRADFGDGSRGLGLDLVHHFHRLDDANHGIGRDLLADGNERGGVRRGRPVKRADHRGFDFDSALRGRRGVGRSGGRCCRSRCPSGSRRRHRSGRCARCHEMDGPARFASLERDFETFPFHFENGEAVFLHEVYERADFFEFHRGCGF